jgi:hypothetical protein
MCCPDLRTTRTDWRACSYVSWCRLFPDRLPPVSAVNPCSARFGFESYYGKRLCSDNLIFRRRLTAGEDDYGHGNYCEFVHHSASVSEKGDAPQDNPTKSVKPKKMELFRTVGQPVAHDGDDSGTRMDQTFARWICHIFLSENASWRNPFVYRRIVERRRMHYSLRQCPRLRSSRRAGPESC